MTVMLVHLYKYEARVAFHRYLVIELAEATLQVESARVGELGEHLQVSNELPVRETNESKHSCDTCRNS